jgi:F-type H+-transporting ATPase subunit c
MDPTIYKPLGAGIAMIGAVGAGIGLGSIFSSWLSGLARNPAVEGKLRQVGLLGFACTELVLLMSFAIAALLIFV